MKKQIVIATGLAVLSTSAWATKSRLEALGQDTAGSYYVKDSRSIFLNPAHVNTFKNYVVTEWGTSNDNADQASTSATAGPHAEGGFFREMGAFSYGVYLGNELRAQNDLKDLSSTGYAGLTLNDSGANYQYQDNVLDLFFGGDMGVQWGVNVRYASGENDNGTLKKENSALGLGLGIIMGDLEVNAAMDLKDESKGANNANDKFEGGGMNVGASYALGDLTVFANYDKKEAEQTKNAGTKLETSQTVLQAGVAKTHEVSSSSRVIYSLAYNNTKAEDKNAGTKEVKSTALNLLMGYEAEANSWLTLRGSVWGAAPFMNEQETKPISGATTKLTVTNTVKVAAGATLSFGKLKVDGSIGTTDVTAATRGASGSTASNGILTTDNLMTRVAVHYWF